jgi:hypothetical protein
VKETCWLNICGYFETLCPKTELVVIFSVLSTLLHLRISGPSPVGTSVIPTDPDVAHHPPNHFTLKCPCFWSTVCDYDRCQQSTCSLWQRPAEKMLNSEACYSFYKNKWHQCLPRSLPTRLKSVFFGACACMRSYAPASRGRKKLGRVQWHKSHLISVLCNVI